MLLDYSYIMNFKLFQMDIKIVFLKGYIKEEVFLDQISIFINPTFPDHVFKIKKDLQSLKQAARAWYDHLRKFLLENKFHKRQVDKNIFVKKSKHKNLLVQIYVHDIIFSATNESLYMDFF